METLALSTVLGPGGFALKGLAAGGKHKFPRIYLCGSMN